jgi:hypothetical protein
MRVDWSGPDLIWFLNGLAECKFGRWGGRHSLLQYEHEPVLLTRKEGGYRSFERISLISM